MNTRIELLPSVLVMSLSATVAFCAAAVCPDIASGITFARGQHKDKWWRTRAKRERHAAKHASPERVRQPRLPRWLRQFAKGTSAAFGALGRIWLDAPVPGSPLPELRPITGRTEVTMPHICPAPVDGSPPWQLIGAQAGRANWTGR